MPSIKPARRLRVMPKPLRVPTKGGGSRKPTVGEPIKQIVTRVK